MDKNTEGKIILDQLHSLQHSLENVMKIRDVEARFAIQQRIGEAQAAIANVLAMEKSVEKSQAMIRIIFDVSNIKDDVHKGVNGKPIASVVRSRL